MTFKKVLLFGVAALALVAFAAPASASAASFLHQGEQINEPMSETFSGWVNASGEGGYFGCEVNGEMSIDSDSAEVVSVEYGSQCYNVYWWAQTDCEMDLPATAEALPWKVEPLDNGHLSLDEFAVEAELVGSAPGCPSGYGLQLHASETLTITLAQKGSFGKFYLGGYVETPFGGMMSLSGEFSTDSPYRFQVIS